MVRALNGVSQLVLMCASTPDAVRNCNSAMSSRSATALDNCGWISTISESVNQRIRSMSCTARSMTTPTFDMRGGNGPTRVMAIERMSWSWIARLIDCDRRIEALDMADHERDAGAARGGDDGAALLDRRGDRLLDHDVDAARDACDREIAMQMRRRRDGDGIDAAGASARRASSNAAQPRLRATDSRCLRSGSTTPTSFTAGHLRQARAHGCCP